MRGRRRRCAAARAAAATWSYEGGGCGGGMELQGRQLQRRHRAARAAAAVWRCEGGGGDGGVELRGRPLRRRHRATSAVAAAVVWSCEGGGAWSRLRRIRARSRLWQARRRKGVELWALGGGGGSTNELADNYGIGVRELVVARMGAPLPPPDLECGCCPRASPSPDCPARAPPHEFGDVSSGMT